jgi:hypothetical protein
MFGNGHRQNLCDTHVSKSDLTNIMTNGLQIRKFYAEDLLEHHQDQLEDPTETFSDWMRDG